jgi:hypothetical protein
MAKSKTKQTVYIGPDIPDGARLHLYGRYIKPHLWTETEKEYWIGVEPKFARLFGEKTVDEES